MTHPGVARYSAPPPAAGSGGTAAVVATDVRVGGLGPISIELHGGEVTGVVSRPSDGGHALLSAVSGLRDVDSGAVTIAGFDLTALDAESARRARYEHVGYVLRDIGLRPELTVAQNIAAPLRLVGGPRRHDDEAWIARLAESFGLIDALEALPDRLSPGRQQCVAIARALATRPAFVAAEEPTDRLDDRGGRVVLALLRTIAHEYGIAIAIATEHLHVAAQCDRLLVVRDGRLVADRRGAEPAWIAAQLDAATTSPSPTARLHPVD